MIAKKSKKDVEVVIKMRGIDGTLVTYEENKGGDGSTNSSRSEKENIGDDEKKKAKKKKTTKAVG